MKIKIVNNSVNLLPDYSTLLSAGMDIRSNEFVVVNSGQRKLVKTGLHMGLPEGYEAQIRPRSGLAIKNGISVLNSPGTIDADYSGEICVILINHSNEDFIVNVGDRICQMVIAAHEKAEWEVVETLEETERGSGGFGSTGIK